MPYKILAELTKKNSSVGIATGYGLDDGVSFPARIGDFSLLHRIQIGARAHPANPTDIGVLYPRG
jgi:hypothetical protein